MTRWLVEIGRLEASAGVELDEGDLGR